MYRSQQHLCCGDNTALQCDYYVNQAGRGLPHFVGGEYQRGHGLGTVLSGYLKSAIPLLPEEMMRTLKRKALTAGLGVATDVLGGKKLKSAMKDRALDVIGMTKNTRPTGVRKHIKRRMRRKTVSSGPPDKRRATAQRYQNTVFQR